MPRSVRSPPTRSVARAVVLATASCCDAVRRVSSGDRAWMPSTNSGTPIITPSPSGTSTSSRATDDTTSAVLPAKPSETARSTSEAFSASDVAIAAAPPTASRSGGRGGPALAARSPAAAGGSRTRSREPPVGRRSSRRSTAPRTARTSSARTTAAGSSRPVDTAWSTKMPIVTGTAASVAWCNDSKSTRAIIRPRCRPIARRSTLPAVNSTERPSPTSRDRPSGRQVRYTLTCAGR